MKENCFGESLTKILNTMKHEIETQHYDFNYESLLEAHKAIIELIKTEIMSITANGTYDWDDTDCFNAGFDKCKKEILSKLEDEG